MPGSYYRTFTFEGTEVCSALGCVIEFDSFEMDPPALVEKFVDVPGRIDGPIDMSEALTGFPTYGLRTMKLNFIGKAHGRQAGESLLASAMRMLHGKRGDIVLSWDPEYTYTGRISIGSLVRNKVVAGFTLTAKCEPFKLKSHIQITEECGGGKEITLAAGTAPTVPTWAIYSDTSINVRGLNIAYQLGKGLYSLPDVVIKDGSLDVYVVTGGSGGSKRLIDECDTDALATWVGGTIANWIWKTAPTGGPVTVSYDWKDL